MNTNDSNVLIEIDEAIVTEDAARASATKADGERIGAEQNRISQIGTLLRYIGVAVLTAGIGGFMVQRWESMGHLARYLMFLGFTGVVCTAGLLCGLKIRENKGARTLLGIVVMLLPLHCAQIGAILYSQVGPHSVRYPSYLYWAVGSLGEALIALTVGCVVLVPMAYMSYSVLARRYASHLCALGFGLSGLLIVPTRDPLAIAGMFLLGAVIALTSERKLTGISELHTREAVVARVVPFAALGILVARQCNLYGASAFLVGVIFAVISAILFEVVPRIFRSRGSIVVAECLALGSAVISGLQLADGLVYGFGLQVTALLPIITGLPIAACLALMSARAKAVPHVFRRASAVAVFCIGWAELEGPYGGVGSVLALVIGILSVAWACVSEQRSWVLAGAVLTVLALGDAMLRTIRSVEVSPWVALGVIGVGTIVGASYLERNFVRTRERLGQLSRRVAAWK